MPHLMIFDQKSESSGSVKNYDMELQDQIREAQGFTVNDENQYDFNDIQIA
jgi:hypothetical protein